LFGFGFLLFCVIRLIGLRAGSHECTDFCPELFPISPTTSSSSFLQLSRKFRRNEIENRVVYPPPPPLKKEKKTCPPLACLFLFFNRRKRHTRHNLPLRRAQKVLSISPHDPLLILLFN
jgi:hypothetical protein